MAGERPFWSASQPAATATRTQTTTVTVTHVVHSLFNGPPRSVVITRGSTTRASPTMSARTIKRGSQRTSDGTRCLRSKEEGLGVPGASSGLSLLGQNKG